MYWRDPQRNLCAQLSKWKQKSGLFPEFQLWVQFRVTSSMSDGEQSLWIAFLYRLPGGNVRSMSAVS